MAEPATEPSYSINYESSSGGDVSVNHGTMVGDYHSYEELQANTPTQHIDTGSNTNVSGHFTNFHDYDLHENSSSHFNYVNDPNTHGHGPAAEPQHHAPSFEQHHATHQLGPFEHSGNHDPGSSHGGAHESGSNHGSSHHDGSHADGGSVSH